MKHRIPQSAPVTCLQGDPLDQYRRWSDAQGGGEGLLLVDFRLHNWWFPVSEPVEITAVYYQRGEALQVSVTEHPLVAGQLSAGAQFERWVSEHQLFVAVPGAPLPLTPQYIPKPWGREVWFTGVEERGVCRFGGPGRNVPIPWLQAVMPDESAGAPGQPLVLLKILDPLPQEVTGDLYFELHREKREVYVVTHVDREAWPDGRGAIRFGFDPQRVRASAGDAQFRSDYLAAVQAYETVRREIDALDAPEQASDAQLQRERSLRAAMDAFTHMQPLEEGDVVVVPLLMPHSLQHGVRTIEFQTPVYERQILSFAQRVLTQGHWDTADAIGQMRLTPPEEQPFEQLSAPAGVQVERIVDFPDFEVRRIRVDAGAAYALEGLGSYGLVMVVEGELALEAGYFGPEQALLLPATWQGLLQSSQGAQPLVFLLALPRA